MPKFSVKKPFTIFVAVVAILVLGVVSFVKMTPDLLPNMDFPYVMIMTTYPGASPEKVESSVTKPMEQSMATLEHIKQVTSTSSENYSMVMLVFEEGTDLDVISVDIQQKLSALSGSWEDTVGAPYVLKINPSMLPVEVAAVSMEGMSNLELTEFLEETLMSKLEGVEGVARVSTSGSIHQELHVILDQAKIDNLNAQIRAVINGELDETLQDLKDQQQELKDAGQKIKNAQYQVSQGRNEINSKIDQAYDELDQKEAELTQTRQQLTEQLEQLQQAQPQLKAMLQVLQGLQSAIESTDNQLTQLKQEIAANRALADAIQQNKTALAALDAQIADIQSSEDLTDEEKESQTAAITGSENYLALQAEKAQLEAKLAATPYPSEEALRSAVTAQEASMTALEDSLATLENALADKGYTRETLAQTVSETQNQLTQVNNGIAEIQSAISQIDAGMLELEGAADLIESQKAQGLAQLNSAAAELAKGSQEIDSALTQIDEGMQTLEDSREAALEQMDLREIVTMETVAQILGAQNFSMPAGYLPQDGINYMVSAGSLITSQEELENLLLMDLGMEGLDPICLIDVANVMLVDNQSTTYAKLNGTDGIVLSFEKQSVSATAETTDNLAQRFRELEQEYPGLKFVSLMDQGDYIHMIVDTIMSSLLGGAVFAVLILLLFLKDLRATFITLCAIPISVVFAIVLMYFSGVTLNMISLSGLAVAVGMLVDNSVVVLENIYRLRSKGASAIQAAVSGASQVAGAVIASTLTTVCVFAPIVFVEGITRQLFTDLALTMTYALLASLIIALTLVPAMASGMLKKEKKTTSPLLDRMTAGYDKLLNKCLNHKALVLILALALLVGSAYFSLSKGFIFMPEMDMPSVNGTITFPEDTTVEEAMSITDQVLERIDTLDGIDTVGAIMDTGEDGQSVTLYITLSDENASGAAMGEKITALCQDLPCDISSSSVMMDMSMLTGSGITLRIYSDDMEQLQAAAEQTAQVLSGVEGVSEVDSGLEDADPALHVAIRRHEAMAHGITTAQIYMELAKALTTSATPITIELDGTTTDVVLEAPDYAKLDLDGLKHYEFTTTSKDGTEQTFSLSDVADVEKTTSLSAISRMDQRRYLDVTATLAKGYNVTLVTTQAEKAMSGVELPEGVSYTFAGENDTIMEAIRQLGLMLLLGVLLVYLVMVAQYQSLKSPFFVMFTIPLAFTGGFLALLVCGMEVSIISMIGFIMLTGIIVNNGIVLVDYINQLRADGMERREAIREAGRTRMRPILMTSITTILGLADMALRKTVGTSMMQPVAVVCIGGLLYATLMTLFVVPCIYDLLNKKDVHVVKDEDLELLDL